MKYIVRSSVVRERLLEKGIPPYKLARTMSMSEATIYRCIKSDTEVSMLVAGKLIKLLGEGVVEEKP